MPTSPEGTVEAHHIWKRFRSDRKRSFLADEVHQLRGRLRGQPYERFRWALRDVDLRVEPGESVGLVGMNGSGKSTLFKILVRVMYPHTGRVEVTGRVGALIEVSAGIHPMLTGRENTYLYGSLLGHSRKAVARHFDEIVAFAEIEGAIDRMVKYYSSGMRMRLGFAVAAFLDPAVLLVDEVLAVGDSSFQQKCLDRMRDVLAQGTTLMFVSHDLASVEATCQRGIWLNNGVVMADGPIADSLSRYRRVIEEAAEALPLVRGEVNAKKVEVAGPDGGPVRSHGDCEVKLTLEAEHARSVNLFLGISEGTAAPIFSVRRDVHLTPGHTEIRCTLRNLPLPRGRYYLWLSVYRSGELLPWHPTAHFDVIGVDLDPAPKAVVRPSPVHVEAAWDVDHR